MFEIKSGKIIMTRGDTGIINLNLTHEGEPFKFSEGDKVIFSVKKNLKDKRCLFSKEAARDTIFIAHEDTENLEPGNYFYDIEIRYNKVQVATIGPGKFIVKYDVTRGDK